jgi:hypothetical protein
MPDFHGAMTINEALQRRQTTINPTETTTLIGGK